MSPAWLDKRRKTALADLKKMEPPTSDEEVWRYSDIDEFKLDAYPIINERSEATDLDTPEAETIVEEVQSEFGELSCLLVNQAGHFMSGWYSDEFLESGAYAGPLVEMEDKNPGSYLGLTLQKPVDIFSVMNDAYMADPLIVWLPPGVGLNAPVGILELAELDGKSIFPRLVIRLEEGSFAKALHISRSGAQDNFVAPIVELSLGEASNLGYLEVEDLGMAARQITTLVSEVSSQANLSLNTVSLGGASVRQRTDCYMVGRGASTDILSLYFGKDTQQFDFRTFQKHSVPDTQSNLLFKGAVDDSSRLIYSGMIGISPEAKSTNAVQANHNLKLSKDAWVESVPNLEIENNDVTCSHASTVGPIDEDQQFYLESRGIPTGEAERLIVAGFFKEALSKLPIPDASATLYKKLVKQFKTPSQASDQALNGEVTGGEVTGGKATGA